MNSKTDSKFASVMFDRINTVQMSASERQAAISALHQADAIADALLWVTRKIEQLGALLVMKPSMKH